MNVVLVILSKSTMRKLLLLCSAAMVLAGCAPTGDPVFRARDERLYPDPALGIKNFESEAYRTQILASPPGTPPASAQSATPVSKTAAPVPAPAK